MGLTNQFAPPRRSDQLLVQALLQQWQNLSFLNAGIPIRPFQADTIIFTESSTQGCGIHMENSQIVGTWSRTDRNLQINCLELNELSIALHHWALLLKRLQAMIAMDKTTVVFCINKQGSWSFYFV